MKCTAIVALVLSLVGGAVAAQELPELEGVYVRLSDGTLMELPRVADADFKRAVLTPFARERYSTRCVALNSMPAPIRLQALPNTVSGPDYPTLRLADIETIVVNSRVGASNPTLAPIVDLATYSAAQAKRLDEEANARVRCVGWDYGVPMLAPAPNSDDWGTFAFKLIGTSQAIANISGQNAFYTPVEGIEGGLVVSECQLPTDTLRARNIDQFNTELQPSEGLLQRWGAGFVSDFELGRCGSSQHQNVPVLAYLLSVNGQSYVLRPGQR